MKVVLEKIRLFLELTKASVSLPVTFLAFVGYTLSKGSLSFGSLYLSVGVFLLAGAASTLNQVLEVGYDSKMVRTSRRPIPSNRVSKKSAFGVFLITSILGSCIILQFNITAFIFGLITLVWYIGVYTMLKRVSAFAVIPGSLTGALPPLIGWTAAGGQIMDFHILFIAIFVFVWQIPHFWLLMLIYGRDYQTAGFPTLIDFFSEKQIRQWTLAWIVFAILISLIPLLWHSQWLFYVLSGLITAYILIKSIKILKKEAGAKLYKSLFHTINGMMVLLLILQMIFG